MGSTSTYLLIRKRNYIRRLNLISEVIVPSYYRCFCSMFFLYSSSPTKFTMDQIHLLQHIKHSLWVSPTIENIVNSYTYIFERLVKQTYVSGAHELSLYIHLVTLIYARHLGGNMSIDVGYDNDIRLLNIIFCYLRRMRYGHTMDAITSMYREQLIQRQPCLQKYAALLSLRTVTGPRLPDIYDIRIKILAMAACVDTEPLTHETGERLVTQCWM